VIGVSGWANQTNPAFVLVGLVRNRLDWLETGWFG